MKPFILALLSVCPAALYAQYYYNDIIATKETGSQMKAYIANKVSSVSGTGYDNTNTQDRNFSELHEVKENGRLLKSSTITHLAKTVTLSRFDDSTRLTRISDSSSAVQNITTYEYDPSGRVRTITNSVNDPENNFNHTETHNWFYATDGRPGKMWRVLQTTGSPADSMEIRFTTDEDGNIAEERGFKKNIENYYIYYYYDDQNRLTDIVRYNKKLQKLIPDIMFEYDEKNRVIQKITTTSDRVVGYLIWRYIFNTNGLKTTEALFNNDKKLTGKIQYSYTYGN